MSEEKAKNKTELIGAIANKAGVTKNEASVILDALTDVIRDELSTSGPGAVTLPGLLKISIAVKPARPAVTKANPFKPGEMMTTKPKDASRVVKVRPLKTL